MSGLLEKLAAVQQTPAMTQYEKIAIILSVIALLIPIAQWAWKKWVVQPKLEYIPLGRTFLFTNMSGSYLRFEGVFEAKRKPITLKNVSVKIVRKKDERALNLTWATFYSPINQKIVGQYATTTEMAHPFRIEADSVSCSFTEYSDPNNYTVKKLKPFIDALIPIADNVTIMASDIEEAKKRFKASEEYNAAKGELEKEFFWEIGKYDITLYATYDKKVVEFNYEFNVTEDTYRILRQNMENVLLSPLMDRLKLQNSFDLAQTEVNEKR